MTGSSEPEGGTRRPRADGRKLTAGLIVALLLFSGWSVYTRYFDLNSFDLVTNMPFRELSMQQYNDTLAGTRTFPYQWRVLGFWIAWAGASDPGRASSVVLGGDLNVRVPQAPGFVAAGGHGVDHVMVRELAVGGSAVVVERGTLSDHAPVIVDVG